jgi:ankyrin repeat protein
MQLNQKIYIGPFLAAIILMAGCGGSWEEKYDCYGLKVYDSNPVSVDEVAVLYVYEDVYVSQVDKYKFGQQHYTPQHCESFYLLPGEHQVTIYEDYYCNIDTYNFRSSSRSHSDPYTLSFSAEAGKRYHVVLNPVPNPYSNTIPAPVYPVFGEKSFTSYWKPEIREYDLSDAAMWGNKECLEFLIAKGVNINDKNIYSGKTALYAAAEKGHKEIMELLIAKGADVNAKADDGSTLLDYAIKYKEKVAELLIAKGANVNAKNSDGSTPLHHIPYDTNLNLAKLLIAKGADVNAKANDGSTPLHCVGNIKVVELLIAKGADVNAKTNDGSTPLHCVFNTKVAELLIAKGADVNAKTNRGLTPLHCAVQSAQPNMYVDMYLEVVKLLIAKGADVNAKDIHGFTPLVLAKKKGNVILADLLREHGGVE